MATVESSARILEEIADFLARRPAPQEVVDFRPSEGVQRRASELLERNREGELTAQERQELDQFTHAELLMRLIKARMRAELEP